MKKTNLLFIIFYILIILALIGVCAYLFFIKPSNNAELSYNENENISNNQTINIEGEEMNGWWRTIDSLYDITITAPTVNWGSYQGTIEKFKDTSTVTGDFTTKYVLVFKLEKDGYTKTERYYIAESNGEQDYDYYMWYEGRSGVYVPMWKVND